MASVSWVHPRLGLPTPLCLVFLSMGVGGRVLGGEKKVYLHVLIRRVNDQCVLESVTACPDVHNGQ